MGKLFRFSLEIKDKFCFFLDLSRQNESVNIAKDLPPLLQLGGAFLVHQMPLIP